MAVIEGKQNRPQNETFLRTLSANEGVVDSEKKESKPYCSPTKRIFSLNMVFPHFEYVVSNSCCVADLVGGIKVTGSCTSQK